MGFIGFSMRKNHHIIAKPDIKLRLIFFDKLGDTFLVKKLFYDPLRQFYNKKAQKEANEERIREIL